MVEEAWQAAERYEGYREAARERTLSDIEGSEVGKIGGHLSLTGISHVELDYWASLWVVKHFDWADVISDFGPYLNRFEMAIWRDSRLLGLAIGRPSSGFDNLTLHFLERCWEDNPLTGWVALIVTDAADNYARVLEKQSVKLKNPVREAIPKYESLGFALAKPINGNTYYSRQVSR